MLPFQSENGSRRAWGAEGDKKKGYTLIGDEGRRFGPYRSLRWSTGGDSLYGDMRAHRAGVMICERLQGGIATHFFSDGKRLSLMSSVDQRGGSIDFSRDEKLAAVVSRYMEDDRSVVSIGSSQVAVPSKWIIRFGFRGDPESFWYAYGIEYDLGKDDKGNPKSKTIYNLMSISSDATDRAASVAQGIEAFGSGTEQLRLSDDRSGIIIKYRTAEGGYIFTGRQILGPFECDEEWLESEFDISPDGKELVYSFKKDGAWYIDFKGNVAGPFDKVIDCPWSLKDGTGRAYALVMKGGKAYAYEDGLEIGGPWDSAERLPKAAGLPFFLAEAGGEHYLYRYGEKIAGPFPKESPPIYAVSSGGHWAALMKTGEMFSETNPQKEWVVVDGKKQAEFYYVDFPRFSPDGRTLALPTCSLALEEELVVSDDGRIVQFAADYPHEYEKTPIRVNRVVVDGKVYVGFYDTASKTALIWDEKAKGGKRVAAGR